MISEADCAGKSKLRHGKHLLDEGFVISGKIKVEVSVISRSRRLRVITLTETKTESQKPNLIIVLLRQMQYRT